MKLFGFYFMTETTFHEAITINRVVATTKERVRCREICYDADANVSHTHLGRLIDAGNRTVERPFNG